MSVVLILSAAYGEGHNAAARGLQEGFSRVGVKAEVLDLFAPAFGKAYERSRKDYIDMVNRRPWLWSGLYKLIDRFPVFSMVSPFLGPLRRELCEALRKWQPAAVVSVYPIYGYLLKEAILEAGIPTPACFTVVTDSITVNSVWHRCGSDRFLVPNEDTQDVMLAAGLPREKLKVSGFPVSPKFAENLSVRIDPSSSVRPRVLFMINGQPLRAIALVERLLRDGHVDLTVTAGKDEGLKRELESMAGRLGRSLEVLGWVSDVPALVKAHHLLIGKAGGAMVQEALAAGTPMIITQVLPGQEEGNARLLTQNGCGVVCPTNEAVSQTVAELFSGEALGWKRMAGHATRLGRPDAARELAQWIQAQLGVGKTSPAQEGAFGRRGV